MKTRPRPRRVGALIVGSQEGGTTALFQFLAQHPRIGTSHAVKEVHYFDRDEVFRAGDGDADAYHRHFDRSHSDILLEATPISMYRAPCAERMARYNPL